MRYTFGDSITADERLKLISKVFNPFSADFIRDNYKSKANTVIDLGCGPGYTTEMLAEVTSAKIVIGIDNSENFLLSAATKNRNFSFIKCDLTKSFPDVKADLIFMRFLLSHLKNISQLLSNWIEFLNKDGIIIIDEVEDVITENSIFNKYLSVNERLIKSQGAELFIGKNLNNMTKDFNHLVNKSMLHKVSDYDAASIFYLNTISIWESDDWIRENISEDERKTISDDLFSLIKNNNEKSSITWKMKRIILKNNL